MRKNTTDRPTTAKSSGPRRTLVALLAALAVLAGGAVAVDAVDLPVGADSVTASAQQETASGDAVALRFRILGATWS